MVDNHVVNYKGGSDIDMRINLKLEGFAAGSLFMA